MMSFISCCDVFSIVTGDILQHRGQARLFVCLTPRRVGLFWAQTEQVYQILAFALLD